MKMAALIFTVLLLSTAVSARALKALPPSATQIDKSAGDLTALSIEELMNIKVTLANRRETTVTQSPAAIFVITQQDIQRSGATTIPELFRRVPGMNVARVDTNKW